MILAGDIGGTHTRLGLFRRGPSGPVLIERETFESAAYAGPREALRAFLVEREVTVETACFGVACPVEEGAVCRLPNLDWQVSAEALAAQLGLPAVRLINDFEAVGHAVPHLGDEALATLQEGESRPGPIVLVGAGTGLGVGYLVPEAGGLRPIPSEGGHAGFAPRDERERRLLEHLQRRYGRASYERVLSGPGLAEVYRFLRDDGAAPEDPAVRDEMGEEDAAAVVSRHGLAGDDRLCVEALDLFVSIYGACAGDLALIFRARGGVYVGGGIAPRILGKLEEPGFIEAFRAKGRMSGLVGRIPVRVILETDAGLLGAAAAAPDPAGGGE